MNGGQSQGIWSHSVPKEPGHSSGRCGPRSSGGRSSAGSAGASAAFPLPPEAPHGAPMGSRGGSWDPTYLLQLGVPWELLHNQGEAIRELQLARPEPLPQQHLPVRGHAQHLEAVAVPGLGQPNHLGRQGAVPRSGKHYLPPSLPSPPSKPNGHPPSPPTPSRKRRGRILGEAWSHLTHQGAVPRVPSSVPEPGTAGSLCWQLGGRGAAGHGPGPWGWLLPGAGGDSCPGSSENAEGSCLTASSPVTSCHGCAERAPALLLGLREQARASPAQLREKGMVPQPSQQPTL